MAEPNRNLPPYPARMPHRRHTLAKVDQHSWANAENTVIESWVDVRADIDAINHGDALCRGETYEINGRLYQVKPDGGSYPIAGPGIHSLTRAAYKALGVYNLFGLSSRAEEILDAMNVAAAERMAARVIWAVEHGGT